MAAQSSNAVLIWIRDPVWIGGLGVQTLGYALYVAALSDAPVSLVAVMMQGGIALFVIFAVSFCASRRRPLEWTGIVGIARRNGDARVLAERRRGRQQRRMFNRYPPSPRFRWCVAVMPLRLRTCGAAVSATAIASGIAFGLGSLYTKPLADTFAAHASAAPMLRMFVQPWLYLDQRSKYRWPDTAAEFLPRRARNHRDAAVFCRFESGADRRRHARLRRSAACRSDHRIFACRRLRSDRRFQRAPRSRQRIGLIVALPANWSPSRRATNRSPLPSIRRCAGFLRYVHRVAAACVASPIARHRC